MNMKGLYTVAELSRMANNLHHFGVIKAVVNGKASALIQTASGVFITPALAVTNRPLGAIVGEACLLLAPQGKAHQGVLICMAEDAAMQEKLAKLEQRLAMLEQS